LRYADFSKLIRNSRQNWVRIEVISGEVPDATVYYPASFAYVRSLTAKLLKSLTYRYSPRILSAIPKKLVIFGTLVVAHVLARRDTAPYRNLRRNIRRVLGSGTSSQQVKKAARRAIEVQSLNYVDLFRSRFDSVANITRCVDVDGLEHLDEALSLGKGAIMASGHVGSIDRAGLYLTATGFKCGVLAEKFEPVEAFELVSQIRNRLGGVIVPVDEHSLQKTSELLKQNFAVGIACDWGVSDNHIPVPFFGGYLNMPIGPALISIRYRAPIVPLFCIRDGNERYRLIIDPVIYPATGGKLADRIRATSEQIAKILERHIAANPDQWVMFHDVWSTGPGDIAPPDGRHQLITAGSSRT
jgi:KDO2-lipid IV(A) lauroyltransferase